MNAFLFTAESHSVASIYSIEATMSVHLTRFLGFNDFVHFLEWSNDSQTFGGALKCIIRTLLREKYSSRCQDSSTQARCKGQDPSTLHQTECPFLPLATSKHPSVVEQHLDLRTFKTFERVLNFLAVLVNEPF